MGKKPNTKSVKVEAKSAKSNQWLIVGGAAIMLCIVWATLRMANTNTPGNNPVTLIATLSPENYTGKARAAYQAAKDIPEILAQLPCFCGCMDSLGHHSNLYCFADTHGAICDLCQNIALDAQEMHRKGIPVEKIRDNIRTTYGNARM